MKWVPLYILTALVTGLHSFYELMSMVNGAPISLLHGISLLGSASLLGAAVLLPFRVGTAAKAGLLGSIVLWLFYAPLVVAGLLVPSLIWDEIKLHVSFGDYVPVAGVLFGPVLVTLCTVNATILLRRNRAISPTVR